MMRVLIVSTYELGHQPLHLALAAARLRADGHAVDTVDVAVETFDWDALDRYDRVAFSVPMHTAMALAVRMARRVRALVPDLPIAFFGLYAALGSDREVAKVADARFAGEYETGLAAWVGSSAARAARPQMVDLSSPAPTMPDRRGLPGLGEYAHLAVGGAHKVVGYTEATRGCRHRCRHCPIPAVYGGRFRPVDVEVVERDVDQLVGLGASHITLGDPDFLNGPAHARRVLRAISSNHPDLTFDVTVKVEHIIQYEAMWQELRRLGVLFVVSAFETVDDYVLELMDKGHTSADLARAVRILDSAGIHVRPSLLPFTPWTRVEHIPELFGFLSDHDLLDSVDPVQLSIRLLVPDGSLLLDLDETKAAVDGYDPASLGHGWRSPDPRVDALQRKLAGLAEAGAAGGIPPRQTILEQWAAVVDVTGAHLPMSLLAGATDGRPRLTEPWFC